MSEKMTITVANWEDGGAEIELPGKFDVCENCQGKGTHVNRAIDGNGLSYEDIQEMGGYEFMDDYMGGTYDVRCDECHGNRVVLVLDYDRCTDDEIAMYEDMLHSDACMQAEYDAERRMGC